MLLRVSRSSQCAKMALLKLAVGRQTQMVHLQTLEDLESLLTQQERLLLALETDLKRLEDNAEAAGVPWTSGRIPKWAPQGVIRP